MKCCRYRQYMGGWKIQDLQYCHGLAHVNVVTNECVVTWKGKMDNKREKRLFWKVSSGMHHFCWDPASEWLHCAKRFALIYSTPQRNTPPQHTFTQLNSTSVYPPDTWDRLISNAENMSVNMTRPGLPPPHRSLQTIKQLCKCLHWRWTQYTICVDSKQNQCSVWFLPSPIQSSSLFRISHIYIDKPLISSSGSSKQPATHPCSCKNLH